MPRAKPAAPAPPNLFVRFRFAGFGPSRFHAPGQDVRGHALRARALRTILTGVKTDAPRTAGVYGMIDGHGRLIYVGKAKSLRSRLMSYFRVKSRDRKAGKILKHTRTLIWEHAANEFAALLRELELIQQFRPRYNVQGLPGRKSHFYVCLGRPPAQQAYVSKTPASSDTGVYGPFAGRAAAELAVRRVNDVFKLRDCPRATPVGFADQPSLIPTDRPANCLRYELGTCLGPCGGFCTRRQYTAAARAAKQFLEGTDRSVLESLRKVMLAASAATNYEKASAVRDKLHDLEWLDGRLSLLRSARDQQAFVYPLVEAGVESWYVLFRGQVVAAVTPHCHREVLADVLKGRPPAAAFTCHPVDSVLLVAAWFRKNPGEREKLLPAAEFLARWAA